jgi:DNA replication protein DnaC
VIALLGISGIGKTTLGVALARAWVDENVRGATFMTAFALASARAESRLGEEPAELRQAKRIGLLVLDDLGNEPLLPTSCVVETLFHRHDRQMPMIVTCAITRRAIAERYGMGAARRLFDKPHACTIDLQIGR